MTTATTSHHGDATSKPCCSDGHSCFPFGIQERPRYYPRQLMTPGELTLEAEYFRDRMRRHNVYLHGWGVVCGALVCVVPAKPKVASNTPARDLGERRDVRANGRQPATDLPATAPGDRTVARARRARLHPRPVRRRDHHRLPARGAVPRDGREWLR